MLIINGSVHTMGGLTIPGAMWRSGDKIAGFGPMEECPKQWEGELFDAQGGHIQPGFVDAHCHLGMFGDAVGVEGMTAMRPPIPAPPPAGGGRHQPHGPLQEAGRPVTTVLTGQRQSHQRPVCRRQDQRPLGGRHGASGSGGHEAGPGENPKLTYERRETPTTRMATAAVIRENLAKAEEYREKLERALEDEEEEKPDYDAKLEALPSSGGSLSTSTPTGRMTSLPGSGSARSSTCAM